MTLFADYKQICTVDAPLAPLTWYKLGGAADWLFRPRNTAELAGVVAECRANGIPWRVLGQGANILVRDTGVRGAVILLQDDSWRQVRVDGTSITAGAGVELPKLIKRAIAVEMGGLESLAGIPGTVGGSVRMNAGGKYGCVANYLREIQILDTKTDTVSSRSADDVGFSYRHSGLDGCIVLSASFDLQPASRSLLEARHRQIWNEKYATQPPLSNRTSGCIFKNPANDAAGRLIDGAGLKGHTLGAARISEKHANFVVASATATAQNVLDLIDVAKDRVRNEFGVELELEVDIW
ncbi:MAG: UDP-N-acetylmuramate dehydrogenase [Phycisphaerae bacterium]